MAKKTAPENPGKCRVEISLKADITAKLHAKAAALGDAHPDVKKAREKVAALEAKRAAAGT